MEMNNVRYKYTLICSEDMDGYPLHGLEIPGQPGESQEPMNFSHPLSSFPSNLLESHVHPCFAICRASLFSTQRFEHIDPDLSFYLKLMSRIYAFWTTRPNIF